MSGSEAILRRIQQEYAEIDPAKVKAYRSTFGSAEGQYVLTDLLSTLGFMSMVEASDEEAILNSVARLILAKCGIWRSENAFHIARVLFELPADSPHRIQEDS